MSAFIFLMGLENARRLQPLYPRKGDAHMTGKRVQGDKIADIMLYGLSTCGWCQRTKKLLDELGVEYDYVFVDELTGADRDKAVKEVSAWNPGVSFPTVVIDSSRGIVGYKEAEIREALGR